MTKSETQGATRACAEVPKDWDDLSDDEKEEVAGQIAAAIQEQLGIRQDPS